eukprot:gene11395-biopygen15968
MREGLFAFLKLGRGATRHTLASSMPSFFSNRKYIPAGMKNMQMCRSKKNDPQVVGSSRVQNRPVQGEMYPVATPMVAPTPATPRNCTIDQKSLAVAASQK